MNILTFDLEEWYIYTQYNKGPKEFYLPILYKYLNDLLDTLDNQRIKATFFCLGIVGKSYPDVIRIIHSRGHEIGCHSYDHKFITSMTRENFYDDTKRAIEILEDITNQKVQSYRAPAFSITEKNVWAFDVLSQLGIEYDCSVFPTKRSFGGFPSFTHDKPVIIETSNSSIKEFPINIGDIWRMKIAYSGGGYFRLVPYTKIKKLISLSDYTMCYFHIRDLDAYQKRVYSLRYFQSYYGIKNAFEKVKKLINDFDFINVKTAAHDIQWDKRPKIRF